MTKTAIKVKYAISILYLSFAYSFKKILEIRGYDPTRADGFKWIGKDSKGYYRTARFPFPLIRKHLLTINYKIEQPPTKTQEQTR